MIVIIQILVLGIVFKIVNIEYSVLLGFAFVFVWLNQIYEAVKHQR